MCEPISATTMTYMAIASAAGTAISAYGSYQQGQNQKKIADYNARMADFQAQDAMKRGAIAADQKAAEVRQMEGRQRAVMGVSGVDVGVGTLGKVLDQTATMGELDTRTIEQNAMREAWGYENQGTSSRLQGEFASQAGTLGGFGTLLAGGARAYGLYQPGKTSGKGQ